MLRTRASNSFAGVLGWPLTYTLSPVIHNAAFRKTGLDWIYLRWPVPPEELEHAVAGLRALGAMGASVTMPHKEQVMKLLDHVSGDARAVGAVNTIQRVGNLLIGHNTDVDGFRSFLEEDAGVDLGGKKCLVLGAGGGARAVVKALVDLGAAGIAIAARTPERGEEVSSQVGDGETRVCAWDDAGDEAEAADVIVNATPIGMREGDPLPNTKFQPGQVVVDLVYDPPSPEMIERARSSGAAAWGGLGMLVHQAAAAFRIWTGQDPPLETMSAAALRAIGSARRTEAPAAGD
jgi:shikimate dehydrogenase